MSKVGRHWLDSAVSWLNARKLMCADWGEDELLSLIRNGELRIDDTVPAQIQWGGPVMKGNLVLRDGVFRSPEKRLPVGVDAAYVRKVEARSGPGDKSLLVLAGSREEGYRLREAIWGPLCEEGFDLYFLENPFYGKRRAVGQKTGNLLRVSDQFLMNVATAREAQSILKYLVARGQPVGIAGFSMGGFVSAITAATVQLPVALTVIATGASAKDVFTESPLSRSIPFHRLHPDMKVAKAMLASLFEASALTKFPKPLRVDAAVIVGCMRDAYVPFREVAALHQYWQGSHLQWIDAGHISALFSMRQPMREAVRESFRRFAKSPAQ